MLWVVRVIGALLAFMAAEMQLHAALVTSPGAISNSVEVTFSEFTGALTFVTSPIQVGASVGEDILLSAVNPPPGSGTPLVGDPPPGNVPPVYGLGTNGFWDSGRIGFVGLNSETATMRFDFNDGLVNGVGGVVNYNPELTSQFTISALAQDNTVLESYVIPTEAAVNTNSNPDNEGAFRGIFRSEGDIAAFTITGQNGVLDNLTFGPRQAVAVPEPSSLAILGFGAIFALNRRRLKQAS